VTLLYQIKEPVVDVCRTPSGPRDRQLLLGDTFEVLNQKDGWSYGRSIKSGYPGYVYKESLELLEIKTHWICTLSSHAYIEPDLKSADCLFLPFGAQVQVLSEGTDFFQTKHGFIPYQHLRTMDNLLQDPVEVALSFLGTPYLWGGDSSRGIDCSGLIQAACAACGQVCPGDSGAQQAFFQTPAGPVGRGQLLFWKGHVAITLNSEDLVHANAQTMTVCLESIESAIARILNSGGGSVTHHARLQSTKRVA
ncbi:MAG: NlpC/P60 family protein, partial [Planktomarina sp.]|nr:NlpC/P60 family protein [Planktomarina sp.]|tara:strand:+ start:373 stop:1125 length:753 start_codon:yes stop_codon:yes gene_type:complete